MPVTQAELDALPEALRTRLARGGFQPDRLLAWATEGSRSRDATNLLDGVTAPLPEDVVTPPLPGSTDEKRLREIGDAAIARGEVAIVVLAGGMATRMGGVVKALVEVLPGKTFLDLRLAGQAHLSRVTKVTQPMWLMTSEATEGPIRDALGTACDGFAVATFPQEVSLRMTPEGELFRDDAGEASLYPTGHGDVPDAVRRSGLLQRFVDGGGKHVWIANLDNLGATLDPILLGMHIEAGKALSVEVVDKEGDKGGIPVRVHGRPVIAEEYRLPKSFDAATVRVFNTNTILATAEAIATYDAPFTYCVVEKKVGGKTAIQRERLLGEITFHLPTQFLRVPRAGAKSRFLPVKDHDELAKRKADIEAVARARGMVEG